LYPMYTPTQFREHLSGLGIRRDLRALTDWRQKGLLPPLQTASLGRGRGVKRYWGEDVVDQAIAVDWLVKRCKRADEALLGLWLSGYPVDAAAAKRAWVLQLKRIQHRRQKASSRSGGFPGLVRSWFRRLQSTKTFEAPWWRERPQEVRQFLVDLLGDTQEWLRDDANRDDEAYRNEIAELVIRLTNEDRNSVYKWVDELWDRLDPVSIFAITPSIEFIEALSSTELETAHRSLVSVAAILLHAFQLGGTTDRVVLVIGRVALMHGFLGALVARALFLAKEMTPRMPLQETISTLHTFVMRVQYTDIAKKNDYRLEVSERVRIEWKATRQQLSQLWTAARNAGSDQPEMTGPPDPASG
jgi:hypothetical protein